MWPISSTTRPISAPPISFGVRATRIERTDGGGWLVHTDQGTVRRRHAIVATGSDRAPHLPAWPGRDHFLGELIHAGAFRHANDYMDRRVPIVGAGNSAFDIGNYLSRVPLGPSWISAHRGPTVAPQTLWGIPTHPCWSGPADFRSGPRIA